ncbi:MAG: hypothetical protein RSD25_00805 [Raoultibacter sp.]
MKDGNWHSVWFTALAFIALVVSLVITFAVPDAQPKNFVDYLPSILLAILFVEELVMTIRKKRH